MGLFDFLQKRDSGATVEPEVSDILLRALLKGEKITREKALMLPAVSSSVDFISNCVASMPIRLYRITDGKVSEVTGDIRTELLNGDTGDTLNGFQLKKAMVTDYLLGKGGYCFIRKKRNAVTGLFYVEDSRIGILKNEDPVYKDFRLAVNGKQYESYEFIKLLRNTKDGASGIGVTDEVAKAIEAAYQTMIFQLSVMTAGGKKKGFLKSKSKLSQQAIDELKASWNRLYSVTDEDNTVVLNNGVEFQEASSSNAEIQLNESKRTLDEQIYSIFHIYGDFDRTFKEAVYPVVKACESSLNKDLLLEREKKDHFFGMDTKEIIKASMTERFNAYRIAKETGFLTINEIRREENLNYIEGLDVINVGLGAVLYDVNTNKYYTPNTDTVSDPNDDTNGGKEKEELPEDDGDVPLNQRFNPNHDARNGQFASKGNASSLKDEFDKPKQGQNNAMEDNKIKLTESAMKYKIETDTKEADIKRQSSNELKRGISSLKKQIQIHEHKIQHPEQIEGWDSYSEQRKSGLIRHWKKEVRNFNTSIANRMEELKKRGDYFE